MERKKSGVGIYENRPTQAHVVSRDVELSQLGIFSLVIWLSGSKDPLFLPYYRPGGCAAGVERGVHWRPDVGGHSRPPGDGPGHGHPGGGGLLPAPTRHTGLGGLGRRRCQLVPGPPVCGRHRVCWVPWNLLTVIVVYEWEHYTTLSEKFGLRSLGREFETNHFQFSLHWRYAAWLNLASHDPYRKKLSKQFNVAIAYSDGHMEYLKPLGGKMFRSYSNEG